MKKVWITFFFSHSPLVHFSFFLLYVSFMARVHSNSHASSQICFFFSPWMSFLVFPRRHKNQSEKKRTQLYTKRAFMCSGLSSFKTLFLYSGSRFMRPTTCMRFPFAVLSWDGMFQQRNNRPLPNNTMNKRAIKSHKGTCGEIDEFRSYEPFY